MSNKKPFFETRRDEQLYLISAVRERIREHVIRSGIQEAKFDAPVWSIADRTNEEIQETLQWYEEFERDYISSILEVWNQKPKEWWENLYLFSDQRNFPEQVLLHSAQTRVRKHWWNRHGRKSEKGKAAVPAVENFNP